MQLVIKTPLYHFTSYCAHLVEHCVLSWYQSEERFFDFTVPYSDAETAIWNTKFWVWGNNSVDTLIEQIQKPLDMTVISLEKKLLHQELLEEITLWDTLRNKIWKILYPNGYPTNTQSLALTKKEVITYHQQWYKEENMWVIEGNDWNIIKRPLWMKETFLNTLYDTFESQLLFKDKWSKYVAFIKDIHNFENYILFSFLEWFYDLVSSYQYRYWGKSYNYYIAHCLKYPDNIAFVRGPAFNVQDSFFERAKKIYVTLTHRLNELALMHEIQIWEIISLDTIKAFLQSITKNQIDHYFLD
jgi:hypothetical protein